MKRLLAYLFIVLGLWLTFSVNADAEVDNKHYCLDVYVGSDIVQFQTGPSAINKYTLWKSDLINPTNDWGNNIKVSQNTKNLKCEFKIL